MKTIPGLTYQVDEQGNVYNKYGRKLATVFNNRGYEIIPLSINNKQKCYLVHRLVATTFIGDINDNIVDHIDNNKTNNSLSNLQIITQSANVCKSKPKNNYIINQYSDSGLLLASYNSLLLASQSTGVPYKYISKIIHGHQRQSNGFYFTKESLS